MKIIKLEKAKVAEIIKVLKNSGLVINAHRNGLWRFR